MARHIKLKYKMMTVKTFDIVTQMQSTYVMYERNDKVYMLSENDHNVVFSAPIVFKATMLQNSRLLKGLENKYKLALPNASDDLQLI